MILTLFDMMCYSMTKKINGMIGAAKEPCDNNIVFFLPFVIGKQWLYMCLREDRNFKLLRTYNKM